MQADNAVRDEVWLNDLDALDRYTSQFTLVGGGGTDFRPAFARIEELRQDGALRDLQGCSTSRTARASIQHAARRSMLLSSFWRMAHPPPEVPPLGHAPGSAARRI